MAALTQKRVNIAAKRVLPLALGLLLAAAGVAPATNAQRQITLDEAVKIATAHYPSIRAAQLDVEASRATRATKWDLGETEFSLGGDEIGHGNDPTWTLLAVRQNFDLFGQGATRKMQDRQIGVAQVAAQVATLELRREVSIDYANAFVAAKRVKEYAHVNAIYQEWERNAKVQYDTQAISHTDYTSVALQARQALLHLTNAHYDLALALANLNRWLGKDAAYTPADEITPPAAIAAAQGEHPLVALAQENVQLSEAAIEVEKAEYRPKLFVEYGAQMVGNQAGYHSINVGVSVPIFSGKSGKTKVAQINRDIAVSAKQQQEIDNTLAANTLAITCNKWEENMAYYNDVALPAARQQELAAKEAFDKGESDYATLCAAYKEASEVRLAYWDTFAQLLEAQFKLQFYR